MVTPSTSSRPTLRFAASEEDCDRVFRFRYQVYVEEMLRKQRYADPVRRRIEEPFDATAYILMAEVEDRVVGTLRANLARETDLSYYPELFSMDVVGSAFPGAVSLSTKFMIAPEHRAGTLAVRMARVFYELGRAHGIRFDFLDCNEHLESFFARLGYRRYVPHVEHPEYGRVLPLCIHLEDRDYLVRIGSPLVRDHGWGGDLEVSIPSRPVALAGDRIRPFPAPLSVSMHPQSQPQPQPHARAA